MAIAAPTAPPPAALQGKALSALLARLDIAKPDLAVVKLALTITARFLSKPYPRMYS